ncbi:MAG: carbohydrate kinase [Spirochaetaceae bacterium]|nr:MAG: carbohydrate kinase [Spirochaetaceae bacterium]
MAGFLLGFDVGSSSIKASLVDAQSGSLVGSATSPDSELKIHAAQPGWAEQDPEVWWEHVQKSAALLRSRHPAQLAGVAAIGISYQMHGLVLVDRQGVPLRPSIIWCDSRAVPYGNRACEELGAERCLQRLLNSPGNFTAAKLAWVKQNEPEIFGRIDRMMLPGDYIGLKLTGEAVTTPSGLSEGILWDFVDDAPAAFLMQHFGFPRQIVPPVKPTFAEQGAVTPQAARALGIPAGIPVAYRAGDQPNNAFSLGVLNPGEAATTAGTSGVVYGILDSPRYDPQSRVNTFVHVNHSRECGRYGVLLCLNGTGILYSWLRRITARAFPDDAPTADYPAMNDLAVQAPIGCQGLQILPYGNGAERMLENRDIGASVHGLNFNIHERCHLLRAGQEGIVFALHYGLQIMRDMGIRIDTVKAGHANMFLSPLFQTIFATVTGTEVHLYQTDGAEGAARGAGVGAGLFGSPEEAFGGLERTRVIEPDRSVAGQYREAYQRWEGVLQRELSGAPDGQAHDTPPGLSS